MQRQYVATHDAMTAAELLLEEDVLELYQQYAAATPMQDGPPPLVDQLRFIAQCPDLQFSVGLDAGKRKARRYENQCFSIEKIPIDNSFSPSLPLSEWTPNRKPAADEDTTWRDFAYGECDEVTAKSNCRNRISIFTVAYETIHGHGRKYGDRAPFMRCFGASHVG